MAKKAKKIKAVKKAVKKSRLQGLKASKARKERRPRRSQDQGNTLEIGEVVCEPLELRPGGDPAVQVPPAKISRSTISPCGMGNSRRALLTPGRTNTNHERPWLMRESTGSKPGCPRFQGG